MEEDDKKAEPSRPGEDADPDTEAFWSGVLDRLDDEAFEDITLEEAEARLSAASGRIPYSEEEIERIVRASDTSRVRAGPGRRRWLRKYRSWIAAAGLASGMLLLYSVGGITINLPEAREPVPFEDSIAIALDVDADREVRNLGLGDVYLRARANIRTLKEHASGDDPEIASRAQAQLDRLLEEIGSEAPVEGRFDAITARDASLGSGDDDAPAAEVLQAIRLLRWVRETADDSLLHRTATGALRRLAERLTS